ncbi:MAG: sulfite exporter TauE/SafE family protein, partial [Pseudomonadota bacterium]
WALASGSPAQGALLLLGFGLGTLPNLLLMGVFAAQLGRFLRKPMVRSLAGGAVALFGVYTAFLPLTHFPV